MAGCSKLNRCVNPPANGVIQQIQTFYIYSFSPFYDILLGRMVIMKCNGCVDYFRKSAVISGKIFHHKKFFRKFIRKF